MNGTSVAAEHSAQLVASGRNCASGAAIDDRPVDRDPRSRRRAEERGLGVVRPGRGSSADLDPLLHHAAAVHQGDTAGTDNAGPAGQPNRRPRSRRVVATEAAARIASRHAAGVSVSENAGSTHLTPTEMLRVPRSPRFHRDGVTGEAWLGAPSLVLRVPVLHRRRAGTPGRVHAARRLPAMPGGPPPRAAPTRSGRAGPHGDGGRVAWTSALRNGRHAIVHHGVLARIADGLDIPPEHLGLTGACCPYATGAVMVGTDSDVDTAVTPTCGVAAAREAPGGPSARPVRAQRGWWLR